MQNAPDTMSAASTEESIAVSSTVTAVDDGQEVRPPNSRTKTEISLQDQSVRMSDAKLLVVSVVALCMPDELWADLLFLNAWSALNSFLGLSLTIFTAFMDQVMVATAEPIIGSALNAGASISWVGTSYLSVHQFVRDNLAAHVYIAVLQTRRVNYSMDGLAIYVSRYDRLTRYVLLSAFAVGRKILLFSALFLFAFGDLVAGFSTSPAMLYIFRSIAGVGGGGMLNLSMVIRVSAASDGKLIALALQVIVSDVVSLKERGKWQGVLSAGAAAGSACGPFVGALLSASCYSAHAYRLMTR